MVTDMAQSDDDMPTEVRCVRFRRPVVRSRDAYNVYEKMHWVCFHYEFEHGDCDVDAACRDPACPSEMI
jgi:hypothetical protein